ncbi:hypothetical protein TNCV_3726191 [Trichonephila clavipes]|nr:hypothetical protein TNCV_3726191 [Trichonephila clavipes]
MSSFLVLCEGDTRNRWRDGQVCPDVRQGTMAPWARRLGYDEKSRERTDGRRRRVDGKVGRERTGGERRRDERRRQERGRKKREGVRDWSEKDDERRWR